MIPLTAPDLRGNELPYLQECVSTGWISSRGPFVARFEKAMAAWCGVQYGVATSSGTAALHLALLALGIGVGDEVLVPALGYVAIANAVAYTGARPVFVDADPITWNLDLALVPGCVTSRTRAILPVHLYGHALDMAALMRLAGAYGLWVVEDCGEAHGASCHGRHVGGWGHAGCFSFFGNKVITAGEGGMLVTNWEELAARAVHLRHQASTDAPYWHDEVGYSYRMTNLQAAVGLAQLERVEELIAARRQVARWYEELLAQIPGLTQYQAPGWANDVNWLYCVLIGESSALGRDDLVTYLASRGVESRPFFQPLPSLPPYRDGREFPAADQLSRQGLCLPLYPSLARHEVESIVTAIRGAYEGREA